MTTITATTFTTVAVYHNERGRGYAMDYGYTPGDPVALMGIIRFYADSDNHEAVAEDAFARLNRGSGVEDPILDEREMRSLSVGDVLCVRNITGAQWYAVQPVGMFGIFPPRNRRLRAPELAS